MTYHYPYDRDDDVLDIVTIRSSVHRTRSERTLSCGHTVPSGTMYRKWVGKIDGEFVSTTQECDYCLAGVEPGEST